LRSDSARLDDFVADYLKKSGTTTGEHLYKALSAKFPNITEDIFAELMQGLSRRNQIHVYEQPSVKSILRYMIMWDRTLWFYASIIASIFAALSAYMIEPNSSLILLRWSLGLLFVLFLPGFVALETLLPFVDLRVLDRCILSIAVSLILDMLTGVALNFTPWGIRLEGILLLLGGETMCLAVLGIVRQYQAFRRGGEVITITP
jgi:uncharacterized membrane protein